MNVPPDNENSQQGGADAESQLKASRKSKRPRRRVWLRRLGIAFLVACCLWLIADFGYSRYVKSSIRTWEQSVTRNADGVRVGCEAYSVGPEYSETALLLIHGIGDSPHIYRKVSGHLAEQGYHCRCMRLTGFGESVSAYQKATINDWLRDVEREITKLRAKHSKVVIVAHSLGGAISINYLAEHTDQADGLVLAAPAIAVSSQRSPIMPVRYWHNLLSSLLCFSQTTYSPFGVDAMDESERENDLRTPYAPLTVINQVFELIDRNQNAPNKLKLPILLFLAEKDKVIDNEAAKKFAERCENSKVKLQVLERSAHAIPVDYQWKEFADSIQRFVSQLK